MELNGNPPNPGNVVPVADLSPATMSAVIAHLEVSTDFEHLVYRESELDAIWSISGFLLTYEPSRPDRAAIQRLHDNALVAHDLVAEGRAHEAAEILRSCI
jgi:hypothetical protein